MIAEFCETFTFSLCTWEFTRIQFDDRTWPTPRVEWCNRRDALVARCIDQKSRIWKNFAQDKCARQKQKNIGSSESGKRKRPAPNFNVFQ